MMLDIERVSGQRLGPGTLYGAITRLEERGWIRALPSTDRRRPYKLTPAGQRILAARLESLKMVTRIGEARLSNA
jgi:DNA-binding PadR family transcriptional regulator